MNFKSIFVSYDDLLWAKEIYRILKIYRLERNPPLWLDSWQSLETPLPKLSLWFPSLLLAYPIFSFLSLSVLVMMARHSSSLSKLSLGFPSPCLTNFFLLTIVSTGDDGSPLLFAVKIISGISISLLIQLFPSYHCQYWWWLLATPLRCPQSLETFAKIISVISISAPCSFLPLSVLVMMARHSSSLSTSSLIFSSCSLIMNISLSVTFFLSERQIRFFRRNTVQNIFTVCFEANWKCANYFMILKIQ